MIEVNNLTRSRVNESALVKVAERVLKAEKIKEKNLSIALVGSKMSRELNKKYRNKDKEANVLSFEGFGIDLGEIVLCPSEIKKDAKKYGMIFEKALAWMVIHGILHILGYTHESKKEADHMEEKEELYLANL